MIKRISERITPQLLIALQTVFNRRGWDTDKRHELISGFTGGRASNGSELTSDEARRMLSCLKEADIQAKKVALRKITNEIYELSFRKGGTVCRT